MNTTSHHQAQNQNSTVQVGPRLAQKFRVLLTAALWLAAAGLAQVQAAGAPGAINYQGRLVSSTGDPLTSGNYQVQFKIWSSAIDKGSGTYVWGRVFPVHVATNGMFNVLLNDFGTLVTDPGTPPVTDILQAFEGPDRYLGLSVAVTPDGNVSQISEIVPRQQLVSAPFAIHSYLSSWTDRATNAVNAAYALTANNATNFSSLTTNDFLSVKKASQTLEGTLAIKQDLNVGGTMTVTNAARVGGTLTVTNALTVKGTINANSGLSGSNSLKWASSSPIVIRTFRCPDLLVSAPALSVFPTGFATNQWSAIIGGFYWDANIAENGLKLPWIELKMIVQNNKWSVAFFMNPETDNIKEIYIDVMFIRREWVDDDRK
jgi:hypothetical protein